MNIAIVGAGFTGLSAAVRLLHAGHHVTLFEVDSKPGGLASGFGEKAWDWQIERHYHHLFRSDDDIAELMKQCKLDDLLQFYSVKTSTRYQGKMYPLDTPFSLLKFPAISFISRIRTGFALLALKLLPWQPIFDTITAEKFIRATMGEQSWQVIWKPLFEGKFGKAHTSINASWFWARIHVRSQQLGYPDGGFQNLANLIMNYISHKGGKVLLSSPVMKIEKNGEEWFITAKVKNNSKKINFDKVIVTGPHTLLHKLVPELPKSYTSSLDHLKSLGAMTLVLSLKKPFFSDETYWLNINEKNWPFLAVVEHTNLADSKNYNESHLVYVGKYLSVHDEQFSLDKDELLQLYHPFLNQLHQDYRNIVIKTWLFKEAYAQPIVEINHKQNIPELSTPLPGLFWASMHHVYPWDRGTNYAVQLGQRVAQLVLRSQA